ncbi:ParB/RepB/Spo0J family partition protein [Azospira sp. APE16]|uniref:ParB/RepB/Spo0J family partition protein n=1 Tax=Azospira sp. APE16 TaxID=3394231 RepID=UPI003A4E1BA1
MAFKDNPAEFRIIDIALIEPGPDHVRQHFDEASLKGLANSIGRKGLIHPLVVQPADGAGRHALVVGERRRRAALLAGETAVPVLVRACSPEEVLEVQVFENLGLGVRAALDPRDMANAIQTIAERFESKDAAAEHFGRTATWLAQATAAANLSPQVSALLESGKISSTSTAIQLEKLAQKNEAKAETLIGQIAQLPEGEKLPKQVVEKVLVEEGLRRGKKPDTPPQAAPDMVPSPAAAQAASPSPATAEVPPWEEAPVAPAAPAMPAAPATERRRVNPGKVKMVAEILGLEAEDEEAVLARLIDEFLALKGA